MSEPVPPESAAPDDVLAACRIQGRLGEGGIAEVFLAEWEGRQVALKMLRRVGHAGLTRRFLREGRLLQRIEHRHIVRCLHVVEGDTPALILELLSGESLDRRLARGPLTAEDAERLAVAMLDALACIHEDGIVHRDVKASNVWWGTDGRVVLMDLGLAADSADPLTTTLGEVVGTYAYMAPEQILGAPSDLRCDLYALGITLYEALTGARPYQARGLEGYLAAHRSGRAVALSRRSPHLPLRLTTLVDRLMARDPAARPASARVAMAMLQAEPPARGTLGRPPLVGRQAARGAVAAILDEGGVLWLTGGPGAGLGAVARMALAQAAEEGMETLQARLGPRQSLGDVVSTLGAGLDRFGLPFAPAPAGVAAAIVDLAREAASGRGRFLVVLEDLDLAPPAVGEWVAGWAGAPGLALVATGASPRAPTGRVLPLRALKLEETRTLLSGLLRTAAVPTGLDVRVHGATSGQPTWIVQLVNEGVAKRWLWMDGWNSAGEPSWSWDLAASAASFASAGAPDTRILERLPPASRRMVELLAVAGTAVPIHVLLRAGGGDASGADLALPLRLGAVRRELRQDEEWVDLRRATLGALVWGGLSPEERHARHVVLADAAEVFMEAGAPHEETAPPRTSRGSLDAMRRLARVQRAWASGGEVVVATILQEAAAMLDLGRPEEALRLLDGPGQDPTAPGVTAVEVDAQHALLRGRASIALGQLAPARVALQAARSLVKASRAALVDDLAVAEAAWGIAIGQRVAASAWEAVCMRAHRAPVGPHVEEASALLLVAERERRAGRLAEASDRAVQARTLTRDRLLEASRRPPDGNGVTAGVVHVYEESLLGCVEIALLRGEQDRASRYLGEHAALRAGSPGPGGDPGLATRARVLGCALAVARGEIGAALDLLRAPVEGPWSRAALGISRLELEIELGICPATAALARGLAACGDPAAPWPLRRAWLRALALTRLAAGDAPAALDALLAGADAADAAEDFPEHALHSGLVALLTGRPERLGDAVERLADAGLPRYQATLLLHGARSTGDPEVLVAAEVAARASGDRMLLLPILQARRGSGAREEAAAICRDALAGLHGPERLRFEERQEVRWALG